MTTQSSIIDHCLDLSVSIMGDSQGDTSYVARMRALVDSDDEDDDAAEEEKRDDEGIPNKTETAFLLNSNSIKLLCAMCIGDKDEGGLALFDLDNDIYKSVNKKDIKPSEGDLAAEVDRRTEALSLEKGPRPKNWPNAQLMTWLNAHPITGEADVAFLKRAVGGFACKVVQEQEEAQELQQQSQTQEAAGNWRGKIPHLHLIHCLMEDDIVMAYLRRAAAMKRAQLDARNSATQPPTVWEMIAAKWNDLNFNPVTRVLTVHQDFASAIHCTHASIATLNPATPIKVENLLTAWRATLIWIITDWEKSGQGDGGHHGDDDDDLPVRVPGKAEFGSLHNRPAHALNSCATYLHGGRRSTVRRPAYEELTRDPIPS
jgi:hypothetical protein